MPDLFGAALSVHLLLLGSARDARAGAPAIEASGRTPR